MARSEGGESFKNDRANIIGKFSGKYEKFCHCFLKRMIEFRREIYLMNLNYVRKPN